MKLSEWILQQLNQLGCDHVFLVPGGELDPLVAALGAQKSIRPIVACHEEGAGFMADGYARAREQLGVCMGIGAPGAANLVPALLAAGSDRSKLLCLTGGSATRIAGKGGFQDSSVDGSNDALLIKTVVRYSEACHLAGQVPRKWQEALQAIHSTLPGVAHLTLPRDLQEASITPSEIDYATICAQRRLIDIPALNELRDKYLNGTHIALLIGRGSVLSHSQDALRAFVERYQIPFALTFAAKGLLPETHPLCLGMFGYSGHRRAIETLLGHELETLLVLGSSMNARDTLCWSKEIAKGKKVIQIDCDSSMLQRNYPVTYALQADCAGALEYLNQQSLPGLNATLEARRDWVKKLAQIPLFYETEAQFRPGPPLEPSELIKAVNGLMPDNTLCFIDSGAHRAFAGHFWLTKPGGRVISATNIGPMGWAIPAAIGGQLAAPDKRVLVITGDGCMRMHGMEVSTAARYQVPVIFLISNNQALGNVYLREKEVNAGAVEMTRLPDIDWVQFGRALGVDGVTVHQTKDLRPALEAALAAKRPFIIDAITNRDAATPVEPYQEMVKEWMES
jgi:acetolactate synthase-1/2/3 large subunit